MAPLAAVRPKRQVLDLELGEQSMIAKTMDNFRLEKK